MIIMAEEYDKFLSYDWTNEDWHRYFNGLEPTPPQKLVLKWKKKWYKKNINSAFDDTYEPPASYSASAGTSSSTGPSFSIPSSGCTAWNHVGSIKATLCLLAYGAAMAMSAATVVGVFPAKTALMALVGAFVLEILAKYGIKFNTTYLQSVLLDDVGVMPMMVLTLLMPGLQDTVRACGMVSPFLTALLSVAMLAKGKPGLRLPGMLANLSADTNRYKVMQVRSDSEVFLGFGLILASLIYKTAPMSALLYWNFMMMRYMMNEWTKASFRKIDSVLDPVLGRIPLVNRVYAAIKRGLYSFVDPVQRESGGGGLLGGGLLSKCSIL